MVHRLDDRTKYDRAANNTLKYSFTLPIRANHSFSLLTQEITFVNDEMAFGQTRIQATDISGSVERFRY
ncbi:hypothetical protein BCU12_04670 [Vibrio sp. 10N.261.55.A7]|nr:hypothetical protein BCU12_04670 [Vibrio sp. 10N.261.55.A7]